MQRSRSEDGWGSKVIELLAKDLKHEFPEMKGFSCSNLKYMRTFAEAYPNASFVHQLGGQIPWKHNCVVLDKVKSPVQRVWYIQETIAHGLEPVCRSVP